MARAKDVGRNDSRRPGDCKAIASTPSHQWIVAAPFCGTARLPKDVSFEIKRNENFWSTKGNERIHADVTDVT
jgi:hypothetical protein